MFKQPSSCVRREKTLALCFLVKRTCKYIVLCSHIAEKEGNICSIVSSSSAICNIKYAINHFIVRSYSYHFFQCAIFTCVFQLQFYTFIVSTIIKFKAFLCAQRAVLFNQSFKSLATLKKSDCKDKAN